MDGQLDQIAKSLADGMSRRAILKGVTAALGLSAVSVLGQPQTTLAQGTPYKACFYWNGSRTRIRCVSDSESCPDAKGGWCRGIDGCGGTQSLSPYVTRSDCHNALG